MAFSSGYNYRWFVGLYLKMQGGTGYRITPYIERLAMKYQLVIQFPEELYGDLDWIADIEDRIDQSLVDAELDGHDTGSGEVNIFIEANDPINSFEVVKNILSKQNIALESIKAGYRDFNSEQYVAIWPKNLLEFNVI